MYIPVTHLLYHMALHDEYQRVRYATFYEVDNALSGTSTGKTTNGMSMLSCWPFVLVYVDVGLCLAVCAFLLCPSCGSPWLIWLWSCGCLWQSGNVGLCARVLFLYHTSLEFCLTPALLVRACARVLMSMFSVDTCGPSCANMLQTIFVVKYVDSDILF